MSKKIIIFDFDGTIADTFYSLINIANELAEDYGYKKIEKREIKSMKNKNIKHILRERGISIFKIPFFIKKGNEKLDKNIKNVNIFPGIKKILVKLKKQKYKIGIITSNSKNNIKKFLKKYKIDFFDFIYSGISIFGKDQKIKKLLKKYKLKPEQVIYVGDEIRDIEAAKKSKIKIISVTWGFNSKNILKKQNPDFLVNKPQEIIKIIK